MSLEGKKLVLVAYHLHPNPGYRPTMMHRFFSSQSARLGSYMCLASDWDHFSKSRQDFPDEPQVQLIAVPSYKKNISLARIFSYVFFSWKLFWHPALREADIAVICVPPNIAALPLALVMGARRKPWVIDIVDLWPDALPLRPLLKTLVMGTLGVPWKLSRNLIYASATRVLSHCRFFLKRLGLEADARAVFLPLYQSNEAAFLIEPQRASVRAEISLCVLGSINNVLDSDSLIRLSTELRAGGRAVCVEILGDGESKPQLVSGLAKLGVRVVDHGVSYDPSLKAEILSRCHFGYNGYKTTTAIGITYKSIDFSSYACPILSSVQGDLKDLIEERRCGIHYESESEDVLARKILNLSDAEITKMSVSSRRLAQDLFRRESFDLRLSEVMERL